MKIYLLVINLIAFVVFALDKLRAIKDEWRISENMLIGIALVGGSLGELIAMYVFRHKIRKPLFKYGLPAIIALQATLGILYL